jgi:hypothetical protein
MTIYEGPIPQELLLKQRENYEKTPGPVRAMVLNVISGTGYYRTTPTLFDISHWNAEIVNGVAIPTTDFAYWAKFKEYFGVYIKCGEAYGTATWRDKTSDGWYDKLYDQHLDMAYKVGSWIAPYIMYEPAWFINRGISRDGVSNMFKGATNDIIALQLLDDPNIAIIVRQTVMGIGRAITAAKMRSYPKSIVDALVIDLEKWYTTTGAVVADNQMAFALRNTIDGLRWLMVHGYLKYVPIIIYTSNWFLTTYGNKETRQVCDENICICAGYYWNPAVLGTKPVTFEQLLADLGTIPNNWHPTYIGKEVFALQVSGDYFKMFNTAQDINCVKKTWAELEAMFPMWKARRDAYNNGTVPEPPAPVPTKTVARAKNTAVNMRRGVGATLTNPAIGQLFKGVPADVIKTETLLNGDVWGLMVPQQPIWMCIKQGNTVIMTITEEPK